MSASAGWTERDGRLAWAFLIGGLLGLLGYAGVGDPGARSVLFAIYTAVAALAVLAGVALNRQGRRDAWLAMAGGLALFAAGDAAFATPFGNTFPSFADACYVLAYPLLILGAIRLARSASPREATVALDSLIMALSIGLVVWQTLIEPATPRTSASWLSTLLAVGYPVGDLVILAILLPLVVVRAARSTGGVLLTLAFVLIAASDGGYGAQALRSEYQPGTILDAGWMLGYLLIGAVALHPSWIAVGTVRAEPSPSLDLIRAIGVSSSVLVPPLIILWDASAAADRGIALEALVSLLLMVLIVIRLYRTIRELTGALVRLRLEVDSREQAEARVERSDRRNERQVQRRAREREVIADALRAIRVGESPEETGAAICRSLVAVPEIASGAILVFDDSPFGTVLAIETSANEPLVRATIEEARTRHLRERAALGPWVERWTADPNHPYQPAFERLGMAAQAFAPLVIDGEPLGLLIVGSARRSATLLLTEWLPAIVEFAGITGAMLGAAITARSVRTRLMSDIRRLVLDRKFRPVFQPIVDLRSGRTVGFEALTRFDDDSSPEVRFGEAQSVGLGADLELAAIELALAAAPGLPAEAWLDLNVSASTIFDVRLSRLLAGGSRDLVLEITEHEEIKDYAEFRAAFAAIDHRARLCVDDAGSGFASLRHVVELGPDIVKLDRSLVMNIDIDEARQAAVAGMVHFAMAAGVQVVAEGIERQEELQTLRFLGVPLGQGYLLGRPEPLASSRASRARKATAPRGTVTVPRAAASPTRRHLAAETAGHLSAAR